MQTDHSIPSFRPLEGQCCILRRIDLSITCIRLQDMVIILPARVPIPWGPSCTLRKWPTPCPVPCLPRNVRTYFNSKCIFDTYNLMKAIHFVNSALF